jgi:hypothetical protein
LAYHPQTDC